MSAVVKVSTCASGETRVRLCNVPVVEAETREPRDIGPLVCSFEVEDTYVDSPAPRPGWGWGCRKKEFTKYAQRTIRDAGAIMDERCGANVVFATFTMPGSLSGASEQLARYSGYAVHGLRAWLHDKLPGYYAINVWEWQTRGALHVHLAIGHPDRAALERACALLPKSWCRILGRISRQSGVDLFADSEGNTYAWDWHLTRQDIQWATKSVGRYLSKYVSKRASKVCAGARFNPASWWGITQSLREEVQSRRVQAVTGHLGKQQAIAVFEAVCKVVREYASKTFSYGNKERPRDRYLVAFDSPVQAIANFAKAVWELFSTEDSELGDVKRVEPFPLMAHLARLWGCGDANAPLSVERIAACFGAVRGVGFSPAMG